MEKYKIALIGCGRVGALLEEDPLRAKPASHMGGINKIRERVESLSICDINDSRLLHCREKWGIPREKTYPGYKMILECERPDIVVIATWTATHRDIALYAVETGVKGIVLEKPAAIDLAQAQEIIDACKANKVKLVVNHERRWDPLYRKTREIVREKWLGNLKFIYGNVLCQSALKGSWKSVLEEVGGGPLLHDGTHLVDMIRYFAGDIDSISGSVKRENPEIGVETTATAMMQSRDGVDIFIETGGMRSYFNFELDLQFEKGRIKVGNGIREYYAAETSKRYTGFRDLVKKEFPRFTRDSDPFSGALLEVIKAMEEDSAPQSSGLDGFKAMEIIFAVYYSAWLNGKKVSLPLKISGHPLKKMFQTGMI
ncbi:MAG: Gfo/Idh/MocA family oxidoreductase [bacterium]|nr:Gfo/Idh/MocA family oxidoreductase [bacterium]